MSRVTVGVILLGLMGLGGLAVWWTQGPGRSTTPDRLTTGIAKIDVVRETAKKSDDSVAILAAEIKALRREAADREQAAAHRAAQADIIARDSVQLQARVSQLEAAWSKLPIPQTLTEARQQLGVAADVIEGQKEVLGASTREILELRAAITELTAATHAQDIALAKADTRDEMRKEMLATVMGVLDGIRADLKEERAQRARERWWSLIPIIGTIILTFGIGAVGS